MSRARQLHDSWPAVHSDPASPATPFPPSASASSGASTTPADPAGRAQVAVVGAGLLGATLALRLAREGHRVELIEAAEEIGGLAGTMTIGDTTWDRFYHVVLLSDLHTRRLLEDLGLADRLRWGTTKTGFYTDGRMHSMSNAIEFLRFEPLGLLDKLRLGGTIFLASRIRRPEPLERQLASDWLRRWSGKRVVEKIWMPLLRSKLGANATEASAAFIWAIIARLYAARRSGLKEEKFGYIDGGYACVNEALRQALTAAGVTLRFGSPVRSIEKRPSLAGEARPGLAGITTETGDPFRITFANGVQTEADRVVCTLAPALTARIATDLSPAERARLSGVTYQGIICAALRLKRGLSPYYVTNITDRWVPFTGVIEMTALVDRDRFGGDALVYLPLYLPQRAEAWDWSDEQIRERFLAALMRMHPGLSEADVVDFQVSRARQVLAISTLDYSKRQMPPVATSVPGLLCLNAAQIPYGTLNVNETLALVERHWSVIAEALPTPSFPRPTPSASGRPAPAPACASLPPETRDAPAETADIR